MEKFKDLLIEEVNMLNKVHYKVIRYTPKDYHNVKIVTCTSRNYHNLFLTSNNQKNNLSFNMASESYNMEIGLRFNSSMPTKIPYPS